MLRNASKPKTERKNATTKMLGNATKCYKMLQNATKCYEMLRNATWKVACNLYIYIISAIATTFLEESQQ